MKLLKMWSGFHCLVADNRDKPLFGRQITFAIRTLRKLVKGAPPPEEPSQAA